ncbi:MAG: Ig-like domain repeat protein, partial [Burkholderiales bacterium]
PVNNNVSMLGAGSCTIEASQDGNANYSAATKIPQTFVVAPAPQIITFIPDQFPPNSYDEPPVNVTVNVTGGGSGVAVELASTTADRCDFTIDPATGKKTNVVALLKAGQCTIQATQGAGTNGNYLPATATTRTIEVKQKAQTITFTAPGNKIYQDPHLIFDLVAKGGGSKNPVVFTSQTAAVCTVSGSKAEIVGAGTCTITADQAGNENFLPALPVSRTFTVAKASQTIVFAPIIDQTYSTKPITVPYTGGKSGNPVVFVSATQAICTVTSTATEATVTLITVGECIINVSQAGTPNYDPAVSKTLSFKLGAATQTITFSDIPPKAFGDPAFSINATSSSGLPVIFSPITTPDVCTLNGTTVTILKAGSCEIQASQPGDAKYNPAPPVSKNIAVAAASQVITFSALANKIFGDAGFTVSATGGASGNAVTFTSTTPTVCSMTGNSVTIVGAGTCTIEASQAGSSPNYGAAASVQQSFVVAKAPQVITFAALAAKTLGDAPFAISATSDKGLQVSFASLNPAACEVAQNTVTITAAGTCTIRASQGGNANIDKAADVDQRFNVNPANGDISFAPLVGQYKAGDPITLTVTVKGAPGSSAVPTGTVTFSDVTNSASVVTLGSAPLVNGVATLTTSALAFGNHKITATYSGDANNKAATSDVFGLAVLVQATVTGGGGSSGSTGGGGGGCTIESPTGSRNGMDPTFPMLLIGALIYFNRKNMNKIKYLPIIAIALFLGAPPAIAADAGAYFGVGGGKSNTEGDNFDFSERLKREGFTNVTTTLKFDDLAWKVFGGYQINQYFAIEAAYVSLGKATSTAEALVVDPAAFADAVAKVQPRLAKGSMISLVGSMPVNPKFFAYAKLGAFHWDAEVGASTGSVNTLRTTRGNSAVVALGGEAELGSGWSARGEIERYVIKPDAANVFSLNLVYRF